MNLPFPIGLLILGFPICNLTTHYFQLITLFSFRSMGSKKHKPTRAYISLVSLIIGDCCLLQQCLWWSGFGPTDFHRVMASQHIAPGSKNPVSSLSGRKQYYIKRWVPPAENGAKCDMRNTHTRVKPFMYTNARIAVQSAHTLSMRFNPRFPTLRYVWLYFSYRSVSMILFI